MNILKWISGDVTLLNCFRFPFEKGSALRGKNALPSIADLF